MCDAGLFHSVYGTESFTTATIPETLRPEVQDLIGAEAEGRAWLFGVLSRRHFVVDLERTDDHRIQHRQSEEWVSISKEELRDLVDMIAANQLEQLSRMSPDIQVRSLGFLNLLREHTSENAARSIDETVEGVRAAAEK